MNTEEKSTELAVMNDQRIDIDELGRIAKMLALSGYFKTTGNIEVAIAQMATKVLAGREMGFGPFASATGIEIINGRPAVGARLIAAAIKASPRYDYRIRRADTEQCTIEFFERGESIGTANYTMAEAKGAGLSNKDNWKSYPSDMLFARCISRGQRRFCPDVFSGASVYTPEELGSMEEMTDVSTPRIVVESTGEIIEGGTSDNPFEDEVDFGRPPARSTPSVSKQAAAVQSAGTPVLCPHCHAPAGKPHARGCPNANGKAESTPAVETNDEIDFSAMEIYASILHNPDIELSAEALDVIKTIRNLDSNGKKMTKDQHGYIVGLVDAAYGSAELKPHGYILSALCGRVVDHDHPMSYACKEMIDWFKSRKQFSEEMAGIDAVAEAVLEIYREMEQEGV